MLSQAWLCSARARSPGGSCGGHIEGSSTQAGFQLKLLDPYSDSFCFSRRALHNLSVTGALGQLAQHFRDIWCTHLKTGLKLWFSDQQEFPVLFCSISIVNFIYCSWTSLYMWSQFQNGSVQVLQLQWWLQGGRKMRSQKEKNVAGAPPSQHFQWSFVFSSGSVKVLQLQWWLIYFSEMHACCLAKLSIHAAWYGWIMMHFS